MLCELGDGAVNMGAWHESLNLAALWNLPVVFLVVNNVYGMGTSVERASAEPELFKRAAAYRMHGERVDGDDLEAVSRPPTRLLAARPRGAPARRCSRRSPTATAATRSPTPGSTTGPRRRSRSVRRATRSSACRARLLEHGDVGDELDELPSGPRERVEAAVEFARAEPRAAARASSPRGCTRRGSAEQFARMRPGSPFGEEELVFDAGLGR